MVSCPLICGPLLDAPLAPSPVQRTGPSDLSMASPVLHGRDSVLNLDLKRFLEGWIHCVALKRCALFISDVLPFYSVIDVLVKCSEIQTHQYCNFQAILVVSYFPRPTVFRNLHTDSTNQCVCLLHLHQLLPRSSVSL